MAGKLKGITIEIGGNTSKLDEALENSRKSSNALQKELKTVDKLLKFDPSNIELLTQKQDILTSSIDATKEKLDILRQAEEQLAQQLESGEIGEDQYRAFQRELLNAERNLTTLETKLSDTQSTLQSVTNGTNATSDAFKELTDDIDKQQKELDELKEEYARVYITQGENSEEAQRLATRITDLNSELNQNVTRLNDARQSADRLAPSLNEVGDEAQDSSAGFTIMKGALADLTSNAIQSAISSVGNLVGSLFELTEATREYRVMQAKLEASATSFGYSMEYVKSQYDELYTYVNDDQMATNAITNLLGLGLATEDVSKLVDGAISVWANYGDSIPIESLTESTAETINVGKVTGTLADTINWVSLSHDKYNSILRVGSDAQKSFTKSIDDGLPVEDALNEALKVTTDRQERARIVGDLLNETYKETKDTYDELNKGVLDSNRAQLELKETQAELAETIEPVNARFNEMKEDALESVIPLVENLADGFLNLMDYFEDSPETLDLVKSLIVGLASSFSVLAGAMAIQGLITAVTKAFALLSATIIGNPFVLATTGAIGLATALYTFASRTTEADKELQTLYETVEENTEAWKQLKEAQEQTAQASISEIDYTKRLKSELDTLVDANGQIKEGYETRANFIVGELSSATGTEISIVDGVIQKYDELSSSIDSLIEKKRAQIILDSQLPAYEEAVTKRTQAITDLNKLEEDYITAKAERDQILKDMEEAQTSSEFYSLNTRLALLNDEYTAKSQAYNDQLALVSGYNDTIAQYEYDAKLLASGNAEDIALINNRYAQSYEDKGQKVVLSLQTQIANEQALLNYYKEQYALTNDQMYLDQINATQQRLDTLNDELEANKTTLDTQTPQITNKWQWLAQSSLDNFKKYSNQYKPSTEAQVNSAVQGVNAKKPTMDGAMLNVANSSLSNFKSQHYQYTPAGEETVEGVKRGINNREGSLFDKLWDMGKGMINSLMGALGIHSPSKEMEEKVGVFVPDGVEVGVRKNTPKVINSIEDMGEDMISTAQAIKIDRAMSDTVNIDGLSYNVSGMSNDLSSRIDRLYDIMAQYLPNLATNNDLQVVLDTGELVGALAPSMDASLGDLSVIKKRGG